MQQFAGGVSSFCAGLIVVQTSSGRLEHYHVLGAVVASAMLLTLAMMWNVNRLVHPRKRATQEMTAALEAGGVVP